MRTYYPTSGNISGLEKELQDSIDCGECLPPCNNVYYNVGTVSIALHAEAIEELWEQKLSGRNERTPVAVVKIYHARRRSLLYVQDVVSEWFNMLSMFVGDINYTATSNLLWVWSIVSTMEFVWSLQATTVVKLDCVSASRC